MKNISLKRGFTLLEVLLVIGLIAILAGIVIVAINPSRQLTQANDTQRTADVQAILNAVYQYTIDNDGTLPDDTDSEAIDTDVKILGEDDGNCSALTCTDVAGIDADCIDLSSDLTPTYIGSLPINPGSTSTTYDADNSGYVISQDANGLITVQSCEDDIDGDDIEVTR
jgi:prepilin-type N-terminal cleavage/methylation domain-containing protein